MSALHQIDKQTDPAAVVADEPTWTTTATWTVHAHAPLGIDIHLDVMLLPYASPCSPPVIVERVCGALSPRV